MPAVRAPARPFPTRHRASEAASPLSITTYVPGNDEVVHPDVVDAGAGGWNGYRYWMAATPYPNSDNAYENPSLWASDDGTTWVVPDGLTTPVVATPGVGYNSDPDLLLVGSTMHLFWREVAGTDESVKFTTSTDGTTWAAASTAFTFPQATRRLLSPALTFDGSTWRCWAIDIVPTTNTCVLLTASDPAGPWSGPTVCNMPEVSGKHLWHIDVVDDGDHFHAFVNVNDSGSGGWAGGQLWYYRSRDGDEWARAETETLDGSTGGWDDDIYRASAIPDGQSWRIWYSAKSVSGWFIGETSTA